MEDGTPWKYIVVKVDERSSESNKRFVTARGYLDAPRA